MDKKLKVVSLLIPIIMVFSSMPAFASEGEISLTNQEGTNAECKAFSVLMPSLSYSILMTCRQIVYPGNVNEFNYVAWTQPTDGGNPERLGTIGVGKVEFDTNEPFNRIFVTRESSSRPRTPSTNEVMAGNVEAIPFKGINNNQTSSPLPQQTPTPAPTTQPGTSLFSRLFQPGTIIAFAGVSLLLVLVFILTRR